mmetsp:Transcript_57410/g.166724  ORF Transcript_57410/g.166724 Transcript_57410/m.166724 type:complete len:295 (-) Transcript_57410:199-1083(-)
MSGKASGQSSAGKPSTSSEPRPGVSANPNQSSPAASGSPAAPPSGGTVVRRFATLSSLCRRSLLAAGGGAAPAAAATAASKSPSSAMRKARSMASPASMAPRPGVASCRSKSQRRRQAAIRRFTVPTSLRPGALPMDTSHILPTELRRFSLEAPCDVAPAWYRPALTPNFSHNCRNCGFAARTGMVRMVPIVSPVPKRCKKGDKKPHRSSTKTEQPCSPNTLCNSRSKFANFSNAAFMLPSSEEQTSWMWFDSLTHTTSSSEMRNTPRASGHCRVKPAATMVAASGSSNKLWLF